MLILGIETSCDETSAAVVENGRRILSNAIFSQIALHRKTGGVVPEVACREHVVKIVPMIKKALKNARVKLSDIDAIAVTAGPGLLSSLLIGVNAAMTIALVLKKPLIPINHIEGHIYANWLDSGRARKSRAKEPVPKFPAAVLTVSGGHNELLIWKGHGEYKFLGATLDDAAGEAFDKVARLLGLPYPGGPEIQRAAVRGDPNEYPLPRAWLPEHPWDFSFSGLKTAVLYLMRGKPTVSPANARSDIRFAKSDTRAPFPSALRRGNPRDPRLAHPSIADVAASFQEAVCEVLATKLVRATQKYRVKEVHLAGGVSANLCLRGLTEQLLAKMKKPPVLRFCKDIKLCTDNAAMIAAAGYFKYKKSLARYKKWRPIIADPNLEIKSW